MIENERQLRHSCEALVRMYRTIEREEVEPLHHPELRQDIIESTMSMVRQIEREVAEYLAKKYELVEQASSREAEREPAVVR
jgi:histidinol phosphatase-like PHP family hydrolase